MTDNVHELPPPVRNTTRTVVHPPESCDWIIGPFPSTFPVIVDGRLVPNLTAYCFDNGEVSLHLPGLGADFPSLEVAQQAAGMIAQAMALGAGYRSFWAETKDGPFAPGAIKLDKVPR